MQGFSMKELFETYIQAEANYYIDMGRYVPPEHEGVTSANKLAGKYDIDSKPIPGICSLVLDMHWGTAQERQAKAFLPFDLRCLIQFGAPHVRSRRSSDKVSASMQRRKKLGIIIVPPSTVSE